MPGVTNWCLAAVKGGGGDVSPCFTNDFRGDFFFKLKPMADGRKMMRNGRIHWQSVAVFLWRVPSGKLT